MSLGSNLEQEPEFTRVAKVIFTWRDKVIIEQRVQKEGDNKIKHSLFGGKCDDGEGPERALQREIKEEVGIELDPSKIIFFEEIETISEWNGHKKYYVVWACTYELSDEERSMMQVKDNSDTEAIIEVTPDNYAGLTYIERYGEILHDYMKLEHES